MLRASDDDEAPRPPWQWVAIGVAIALSIFAPMAMLSAALGRRASAYLAPGSTPDQARLALEGSPERFLALVVVAAALPLFAFATATGLAGAVIGRFGGRAGVREAQAAAAFSAVAVVAVPATQMPIAATLFALVFMGVLGVVAARLGAQRGLARRLSPPS